MLLSSSERVFIAQGIGSNLRADGRGRFDYRQVRLDTNPIPQALGSARLRLGGACDVLVAVRAEISQPAADTPNKGTVSFSFDSPSAASVHVQQQQEKNVLLARQLEKILMPSLDLEQLLLMHGKHCWALSVDVLGLGIDGNLVDAAVLACRAALQDTQLPGVSIEAGAEGNEISLSNDPKAAQRLRCDALPIAVTLGLVHDPTAPASPAAYFVDPTAAEEECAQAALTVAFNPQNMNCCCFVEKSGSVIIDPSVLQDMVQVAQSTAQALAVQLCQ